MFINTRQDGVDDLLLVNYSLLLEHIKQFFYRAIPAPLSLMIMIAISFALHGSFDSKGIAHEDQTETKN